MRIWPRFLDLANGKEAYLMQAEPKDDMQSRNQFLALYHPYQNFWQTPRHIMWFKKCTKSQLNEINYLTVIFGDTLVMQQMFTLKTVIGLRIHIYFMLLKYLLIAYQNLCISQISHYWDKLSSTHNLQKEKFTRLIVS